MATRLFSCAGKPSQINALGRVLCAGTHPCAGIARGQHRHRSDATSSSTNFAFLETRHTIVNDLAAQADMLRQCLGKPATEIYVATMRRKAATD